MTVMAKISARAEFNCMPRLFDILDSQNGCSSPEMTDYSRKLDHRTSFDEECRKIQYEADLASSTVNGSERSLRDLIREDMHILKQKNKDTVVKRLQGKKSLKAYQSCLCQSNDSTSLIHEQPSTSAEMSLNRLATAAPLGTVCTHNHRDEVRLSEGFRRSVVLEKHDQQGQMRAKTFVDHIFADRKFESKPFSEALEVLNSDKDLIIELLSEPNCVLQKCSRNLHSSQTERETFSSVSEAKHFLKKIGHQFPTSSKTCPTSQQSNERVTLKAELQIGKSSGKFDCDCPSGQSRDGSSSRALNGSLTSFSVREIKRRLKHTFGSRRKESNSNQFPKFGTSGKLSHNRSISGHGCIYRGVEAMTPLSSTTNAKVKEKLCRKQGLKAEREPHVSWEIDTARKKIDVSSYRLCKKHGVDVAWDATRDLPARLKDLKATGRVISSHEIDSCLSPRRESQYCSGSAQVSFSPYRQRTCLSPMRTSKEVTVTPYDGTTETVSTETSSSLVPSTDEEEQDAMTSPTRNMKFNETNDIRHSEANHDTMIINAQTAAKIKLHDKYGGLLHSVMDSITENETFSNAVYDFPSSPTLDMRDNTKNQDQEHQSPVSVLDHFFAEDCSSPSNTASQSARDPLKPQRLHFEERTLASPSQDYTISNYVRVIIQASSLDWDQLSAIRPLSEHLLHPSLFDQAQFLLSDPHFDTRLLFNHVNEVLLETQRSHFVSPYWPALVKPRICCLPLQEAVIDEIMREAEFYLLPQTQKRTLDQLVANDLSGSRLQLDVRPETEQIIIHISEDILEESILDVILQLHS